MKPRRGPGWRSGNHFELLENGEAFFPAVIAAVDAAEHELLIETFILFEDKVGLELRDALLRAAARGVQIDLTVDGFGSGDLTPEFTSTLAAAGVRLYMFDPQARIFGYRTNWFRRMHRKLVVVDGSLAFVGGINYSADHLADFGPQAKQDYAVSVKGPVVEDIHRFMLRQIEPGRRAAAQSNASSPMRRGAGWLRAWKRPRAEPPHSQPPAGNAEALFITRDNREHRTDIERHYRAAIRTARRDVTLANAYFFPGWRLLHVMRRAARRGVKVRLVLQGEPDMPIVKVAAGLLYEHLLRAGVEIYEYCERPLHGKVAVIDDEWATVGSSNLDPLSLSLNLEANVVIRDRGFNSVLRERLDHLIDNCCSRITAQRLQPPGAWDTIRGVFVFHFLRRFPAWAGWLPAHVPVLQRAHPHGSADAAATPARAHPGVEPLTESAKS